MTISNEENDWHTPQVNKHRVWQAYVDSYHNHSFGILQENGQNSFDAYEFDRNPKEMKIIIKYDADNRILSHRDFNSSGMPHCRECTWGIKENGFKCTNSECSWGCFHNMGYSGKGATDLGSRGMGKCLQLLSGKKTTIKTTLPNGRTIKSIWERVKGDWKWKFSKEEYKPLSSSGTEIITYEVIDEVHKELIEYSNIEKELQERWFRLLSQGVEIQYILTKNGKRQRRKIKKLTLPDLDTSQGIEKARRIDTKIVVTYKGERIGELRNLELYLAKHPFSSEDRNWGIALIKNGKQTITRFTDYPESIPENIRKRIFGLCDVICTPEEPFLKSAENSQHTGYLWGHPNFRSTKKQLREIVQQFAQPFIRAGGQRVTAQQQKEARDILRVFNQALADVPEFGLFGKEIPSKKRKVKKTPKEYIYLSRVEFENKSYKRKDIVPMKAVIKNPTNSEVMVKIIFEHFDPTPVVVEYFEDGIILPPGTISKPSTVTVDWKLSFDPNQAPGIHWIQVSLRNLESNPLINNKGEPIKIRRHIYCEFIPPKIERTRSGTGDETNEDGSGGGEGSLGLANLQWYIKPELKDDFEAHIDMSQAAAFVNAKGRRLEFARKGSKSKKIYWPIVGEIVAEQLLIYKADLDAGEKEEWTAEELKNKIVELESSKAKLIRKMIEILGG